MDGDPAAFFGGCVIRTTMGVGDFGAATGATGVGITICGSWEKTGAGAGATGTGAGAGGGIREMGLNVMGAEGGGATGAGAGIGAATGAAARSLPSENTNA